MGNAVARLLKSVEILSVLTKKSVQTFLLIIDILFILKDLLANKLKKVALKVERN